MQSMPIVAFQSANSILTGFLHDASDEGIVIVCMAPKDGNIERVIVPVELLVGVSPTFRIRLETMHATSHSPTRGSGTLFHANADVTFTLAANKNSITFASPVPVLTGDVFVIVFSHSSGTIDASNNVTIRNSPTTGLPGTPLSRGFPAVGTFKGATFTATTNSPTLIPMYDDDTPLFSTPLWSAMFQANSHTAGLEAGNKFTLKHDMQCVGFWSTVRWTTALTTVFNFRLYNSSGTVLRSLLNTDARWSSNSATQGSVLFPWEPITLSAGQSYRIAAHCTGAVGRTGWVTYYDQECVNIMYSDIYTELVRSTRTYNAVWNESDWTQDALSTHNICPVGTAIGAASSSGGNFPLIGQGSLLG